MTHDSWPTDEVRIKCGRCGRRETFLKDDLTKMGDARLADLRTMLTASCPRRQSTSVYEQCGATYDVQA